MTKKNVFQAATLAASMMVIASSSASAVEQEDYRLRTTRSLYNVCSTSENSPDFSTCSAACNSFIRGVVQYHDGVSDETHLKRVFCYPQGATVDDGVAAFVAWSERNLNNPQLMGELPVIGLVKALKEKYPCAIK